MRTTVVGGLAAFVAIATATATAQPAPDPTPEPGVGKGRTEMPVNMPNNTEVMSAEGAGATTHPASVSLEEPIDPAKYICGPGDVFELNFWGQQNFRLRIAVDLEGRTFISKVGFVPVSGKTLSAVRADVKKKVRSTYPGLQADLTLISPRTFIVHVADNVKSPGSYSASPVERVSAVLARAGGVSGSRRRISIKRKSGGTINSDLVLYELTGNTDYNPYVLDGDVITVPFPDVVVTVSGAVRRPGTYELVKTKDINELLELAGGLSGSATRSLPLRLVRRNEQEREAVRELAFPSAGTPNEALRDDDVVMIRSADDLQRSVLLIGAVVGSETVDSATTSKRLIFFEGDSVMSIIERAGGIKAPGDLKRSYVSREVKNAPPKIIPIDLEALLVRRDFKADVKLEMNDTIVVPQMRYSVLVEGAVGRSGLYNYNPMFTIPEYIAHAGGRSRTARDLDQVKLIDANGATRPYKPGLRPSPGDAILVPERNFSRPEIAQLVLAGAGLLLSGVAITLAATR